MDRVRIKETAKSLLSKNHGACIAVSLIVTFLGGSSSGGVSFSYSGGSSNIFYEEFSTEVLIGFLVIFVLAIAVSFAISAFLGSQVKVGSCRYFLKNRKNHPVEISEIFKSYTDKTFLNVAKVTFIKDIQIFLWSLLCFIPGIIKMYEYAAVPYILSVNPTMDYNRALNLSKKIMYGHKLEYFELGISFMGWYLLSALTCGILAIVYVNPYYLLAEAEFFAYVRENAIFRGIISPEDFPDYAEYVPQSTYGYTAPNGNNYQQPTQTYAPTQPMQGGYAPFTPVQPVTPTQPVQNSYAPFTPIEPTKKPVIDEPVAPVEEPVTPVEEPVAPVEEPVTPVEEPVAPVEEPAAPVEEPVTPVEEPAAPVEEPAAPVEEPAAPVEEPAAPVEEPAEDNDESNDTDDDK